MSPYLASWTPMTNTVELPRVARGTPLAEQMTQELLVPLKPPVQRTARRTPRREWVWFAAPLAAGLLYVAQIGGLL